MEWPLSTGQVCKLLEIPDHVCNNLIRCRRLDVPLSMGRRAWYPHHLLKISRIIGKDSLEIRNLCIDGAKAVKP